MRTLQARRSLQSFSAQAQARENIEIVEYMTMVDLISADNICAELLPWTNRTKFTR